jgi:hypothetical protein
MASNSKPRIPADRAFLLKRGWTVARENWCGFIKQVFWLDPQRPGREVTQETALWLQGRRDYEQEAARDKK